MVYSNKNKIDKDMNDVDVFPDNDYGERVKQLELDEMKRIIHNESDAHTVINYPHKLELDIAVIEDNDPILNVHVMNNKWDSCNFGLISENEYHPTEKIERFAKEIDIPLYVCRSSKRINQTLNFIDLWLNKEFNELYKLYPNKIKTINYIR
jgi:hypothetical protein